MSDDMPMAILFQQAHARPVAGEHLEVLGKKAAANWDEGKSTSLTEAVTEIVKHASLSPEQVQRVIEFANTEAYLLRFSKEGSAGHKVVDFGPGGPADPSQIIKDLNDGGGGGVFDRGEADYNIPPSDSHEKTSSDHVEEAFVQMFANNDVGIPLANPLGEAYELREKLGGAYEHLSSQVSGLETMHYDLTDRLYHQVKQAALSGMPLADVVYAWSKVAPSDEHIKCAFSTMNGRLVQEQVFSSTLELVDSLEKQAAERLVNTEHPLIGEFLEYCEVLDKLAELRAARQVLKEGHEHLSLFLKEAGAKGAIHKIYEVSGKAGKHVGEAAERAATFLGAEAGAAKKTKDVAEAVTKHVPTVGGLIAADAVRRHVKYNPALAGPVHTLASAIPGTSASNERNYRISTGQ